MTIKANSETTRSSSTAPDSSDDHFTWVLPTSSIEKYWVLPYENMWHGCCNHHTSLNARIITSFYQIFGLKFLSIPKKSWRSQKLFESSNNNIPRGLKNCFATCVSLKILLSSVTNDSWYKFLPAIIIRLATPSKITRHLRVHRRIFIIFVLTNFPESLKKTSYVKWNDIDCIVLSGEAALDTWK